MPRVESAVAEALKTGGAVVALESTIVTHGMPYPDNLETARAVEADVRKGGATPATIAVIDGDIRIGLDDESLEALARADDVMKLSRADLAVAIAQKRTGSTTVAATMICARLAGITVFATGGIGGVHRGAEESFDISADEANDLIMKARLKAGWITEADLAPAEEEGEEAEGADEVGEEA